MKKKTRNKIIVFSILITVFILYQLFLTRPSQEDYLSLIKERGLILPYTIMDVKYNSNTDNFFGDGYTEVTFKTDKNGIDKLISQKVFNTKWKEGIPDIGSINNREKINYFENTHRVDKKDMLFYNGDIEDKWNYKLIILDKDNNVVLFQESHT